MNTPLVNTPGEHTDVLGEEDEGRDPRAHLRLLVISDGVFQEHELPRAGDLVLGRDPQCTIRIDHTSVSRQHARLTLSPALTITDLGSVNGTYVRGMRLDANTETSLRAGESVQLGAALVMLQEPVILHQARRIWPHGYFEGRVDEECARSTRSGACFAVLRVHVSDVQSAVTQQRLGAVLRPEDVLGAYAPGEYEVLLTGVSEESALDIARRMRAHLSADGVEARIGVALFPRDARSADDLVHLAGQKTRRADTAIEAHGVAGQEPVDDTLQRIAASKLSVLILGETGSGKEVMAERMHAASTRRDKPLLKLHCAALPETLLESELFGHERGSFTGAVKAKPGLLETADGGTVFLDEVGELPLSIQVKLLRVLEERKVLRIGALSPRTIDVRFIAATNRNLEIDITRGTFRADLYFRLSGTTLTLAPLRKRRREIAGLARGFLEETSTQMGRATPPTLSAEALELLESYPWPGNIRELRNTIERATVLCAGSQVLPEHLPVEKMRATVALPVEITPEAAMAPPPPPSRGGATLPPPVTGPHEPISDEDALNLPDQIRADLARAEKARIIEAMRKAGGKQQVAASLLGISRRTLQRRLADYGIGRPRRP